MPMHFAIGLVTQTFFASLQIEKCLYLNKNVDNN